ncbi:MAG: hypothetical protein KAX33_00175, partial [Candidatus Lokiarchaeota archaeon]|nr:hypothetical protein [Candidatus Lokiarchaeota archaeon]
LSILRLVRTPGEIIEGTIKFNGINMLGLSEKEMRDHRGNDITMIFQDPLNSLNPVISVGDQIAEVFLLHQEEDLKKILDQRLFDKDNLVQELKELKEEFNKEKNHLTKEETEDFKVKIKKFKKRNS